MAMSVLNIFYIIFSFVVIIGNISYYELDQEMETNQEIEKWRNGEIIMAILLIYICVIVFFIKSIIVANMARLNILGEDSTYLQDCRKTARQGALGSLTPSVYTELMIPVHI